MVTGSDIMQGVNAFSTMSNATKGDPYKDYYGYMLKRQKCIDDHYAAVFKAAQSGQQPPDPPDCALNTGGGGMGGGLGGTGGGRYAGYGYPGGGAGYPGAGYPGAGYPGAGPMTSALNRGGTVPAYAGGGLVRPEWMDVPHFQGGGGMPIPPAGQAVMTDFAEPNPPPPEPMSPIDQAVFQLVNAEPGSDLEHQAPSPQTDPGIGGFGGPVGEDTPPPPPGNERRRESLYKRWIESGSPEGEDALRAREKMDAWRDRMLQRKEARYQAGEIAAKERRQNVFEPLTDEEVRASREREAAANEIRNRSAPPDIIYPQRNTPDGRPPGPPLPQPGATLPATAPPQAPAVGAPVGQAIATAPAMASQGAAAPAAPVPPPAVTQPAPNAGRPGTDLRGLDRYLQGPSAPPGFPGNVTFEPTTGPASPQGRTATGVSPQASAQAGGLPGGGLGAAPVPAPVPSSSGALPDQTRTAAFDPRTERGAGLVSPEGRDTRGQTAQAIQTGPGAAAGATGSAAADSERPGTLSSNEVARDFHAAANGAHQAAVMSLNSGRLTPQQIQAGQGALSPRATNAILTKYKGLSPGSAMVAGMTAVYKRALEMGDMQRAGAMSFAIVQRANVEAALNGKAAIAALQHGDLKTSAEFVSRGHDWVPDGTNMTVGPDGQSVYVTDLHGKVQQLPLDGRWVLAAAHGLADGSLLWNMINQHAAAMSRQQVKDPIGQQLRHEKLRVDIARGRAKLAAGTGGGNPGAAWIAGFNRIANPNAPPAPNINVHVDNSGGGGGDSSGDEE